MVNGSHLGMIIFAPSNYGCHLQGATKQVSKPAPKPSLSLPSLGRKASQEGSKAIGQAKQVSKQTSKSTFSLPSLGGKARVGKTAKIKAGSAPQKAKKAVSGGTSFLGTGSTRGKSAPAKGGASLGTRSTRSGNAHLSLIFVIHMLMSRMYVLEVTAIRVFVAQLPMLSLSSHSCNQLLLYCCEADSALPISMPCLQYICVLFSSHSLLIFSQHN